MKKWVALLFVCIFANSFSQTNISPQFSELKGMEDQLGNTHLFYRIYSSYSNDPFYDTNNDIYHFDLTNLSDSLFLTDRSHSDPAWSWFISVSDYTFWNDDFSKYIFCGSMGSWEPGPYIKRFDGQYIEPNYLCCEVNQIDISSNNDSLIYSGGWLDNGSSLRSIDGGFNWDTFNESLKFISLNPFNDNILFAFDNDDDLVKSSDGGNSFYYVDTVGNYNWDKFLYDIDEDHIYRTTFEYPFHYLIVSDNQGEAFSWQTKYSSDSKIYISTDESVSGTIYLADKKNIFISTDYGNNFSLYKTLERKIVGIHKKPNSNKLYAATKYKIYEITPDTVQVIKSLPIPAEVLDYYPLAIGNRWVYDDYTYIEWNVYHDIYIREVTSDTVFSSGKKYFRLEEYTSGSPYINYSYERIDSSSGMIYRYDNTLSLPDDEYLIDDLFAEVGDTIMSYRMGYHEYGFTRLLEEITFNKWGLTKPKKVFEEYTLHPPIYSLTQDIGLDSIFYYFDFGHTYIYLKGCIINGTVYGDTTTVGVEDEANPIASTFKLEQNYPNPFNPTTSIQYAIGSKQFVTLKVYDVLGNEIATLVNEEKPAGEYEVEFNTSSITHHPSSGIYFYQLRAGDFIQTKKMILLK